MKTIFFLQGFGNREIVVTFAVDKVGNPFLTDDNLIKNIYMINYTVTSKSNNIGEGKKYYANAKSVQTLEFDDVLDHIISHGCVYSKGDFLAIISLLGAASRELLLQGNRVRLGDLGTLYSRLTTKGADSPDDYSADLITDMSVGFLPGEAFKGMRKEATFVRDYPQGQIDAVFQARKEGLDATDILATED